MEEIRDRIWTGSINVEVILSDSISIPNTSFTDRCCHFSVPRESFLALYAPYVIKKLESCMSISVADSHDNWWFECNKVTVPWEYPVGALFNLFCGNQPLCDVGALLPKPCIQVWKLTLCYGSNCPAGFLPLVNGQAQIKDNWKHQWKQACFILNGSAKRIMSLSIPDLESFWHSILSRDQSAYHQVRSKLVDLNRVRHLPVRFWTSEMFFLQPTVNTDNSDPSVEDALSIEGDLSLFEKNRILVQGIEVSMKDKLIELYRLFASVDGFLYLVII